jgi:hypothetical protein
MATSDIDICCQALAMIGNDPITSLDGTDKPSATCKRFYSARRDELLVAHPWNFAMARASLAASATAPLWDFAYAYPLPADCLRVWRVNAWDPMQAWKVEAGTLITDLTAPLKVQYIARITDATKFSAGFAAALAARVAMDLARALAMSGDIKEDMRREFEKAFRSAKSDDGQEANGDMIIADALVQSRY